MPKRQPNHHGRASPYPFVHGQSLNLVTMLEQIETLLSCDVVNPARVVFSCSNRATQGSACTSGRDRADIEVPIKRLDPDSERLLACYPQGNFCPMSADGTVSNRRVTIARLRAWSESFPSSRASICYYTQRRVTGSTEDTQYVPSLHFRRQPPQRKAQAAVVRC